jgi:hypothetical protein
MTLERHRVLSANFIEAVERAEMDRAACMRRLFLFWTRRTSELERRADNAAESLNSPTASEHNQVTQSGLQCADRAPRAPS